ncbi:MAG: glycosyltransferase, partial [Clostridia bacterium]|nr:glycosyltransferase [Clostridia bacterium]
GVDALQGEQKKKTEIKNVIWIGSVIDRKRPKYLLECAKAFPDLSFTMIGDGDKSEEIASQIEKEGIKNVRCTGRIPNKQVYEELKNADLLLMTSDKEGLPKVIGEAMTSRVPAIYINECYDVDYIQNGVNGYGVADLQEMIDKLQYLLDKPEKYRDMSEKAYEIIQGYLWSTLIKDYEKYFENCLKKYGKTDKE